MSIISALKKSEEESYNGNYYIEHVLDKSSICVNLREVGNIKLPISQDDVQRLQSLSKPAKFGFRDKTLLDKDIRNTNEISSDLINITYNQDSLDTMLNHVRSGLGLSDEVKLIPHLHNMLVYREGQFFKQHQDTEKLDGMVATLLIVLPSPHIGGDLILTHKKSQHKFITENINSHDIKCLAFYADCKHEIEPVRQGERIVLTYNLVLETNQKVNKHNANPALEKELVDYFSHIDTDRSEPKKLIYFFDHSYSEHGLHWDMLKGSDTLNAKSFRSAAKKLKLKASLALVEIHENWDTCGYDYEDDPEPRELIDSSTTLTYWLDENNKKLPYDSYYISEDEIICTKETDELEPYESEYEGWMGNYGNTIDYWYRRAAIVIWPESDQIAMDFILNYEHAVNKLNKLTKSPNNQKQVIEILNKAGEFLIRRYRRNRDDNSQQTNDLISIANYVNEIDHANFILSVLSLNEININTVDSIIQLQTIYGTECCLDLMNSWCEKSNSRCNSSFFNNKNIDRLVLKWRDNGGDEKLIAYYIQYCIDLITKEDRYANVAKPIRISDSSIDRINNIKMLILATMVLSDASKSKWLVDYIISNSKLYPASTLIDTLRCIHKSPFLSAHKESYDSLKNYVVSNIKSELDKGLRAQDDWSIIVEISCKCDYCKVANEFLSSKTEKDRIWPIAAAHRDHISQIFHDYEVPVGLSVKKQGSPHKLIMEKKDNIYSKAKKRFTELNNNYDEILNNLGETDR